MLENCAKGKEDSFEDLYSVVSTFSSTDRLVCSSVTDIPLLIEVQDVNAIAIIPRIIIFFIIVTILN